MNFLSVYWNYIVIIGGIYFLPTFISLFNKKSKSFGIFLFNLFLGWTIVGWISIFFFAFTDPTIDVTGYDGTESEDDEEGNNKEPPVYVGVRGSEDGEIMMYMKKPK